MISQRHPYKPLHIPKIIAPTEGHEERSRVASEIYNNQQACWKRRRAAWDKRARALDLSTEPEPASEGLSAGCSIETSAPLYEGSTDAGLV